MNAAVRVDLYHDTRRPLKDGQTFPVKLRVTYDRLSRFFATQVALTEEDYERITKGKYLKEDLKKHSEKLSRLKSAFHAAAEITKPFSFERFISNLNPQRKKGGNDLFSLMRQKISELKELDKVSTAKSYQSCLNVIEESTGKKTIPFHEVSVEWLNYLERLLQKRGNSPGTIALYMRYLRHLYKLAIDARLVDPQLYPFGLKLYRIKSPAKTKKALNKKELEALLRHWKASVGPTQKALDYWFFSLFSNGLNMRDMLDLKWKNFQSDVILLRRSKTKGTSSGQFELTVHLNNFHWEILSRRSPGFHNRIAEDYVFPDYALEMTEERKYQRNHDRRRYVSKKTRETGKKLGIDTEIRFETARHTFANSLKYLNVSTSIISNFMGHTSTTTTDKYLGSIQAEEERNVMQTFIKSIST